LTSATTNLPDGEIWELNPATAAFTGPHAVANEGLAERAHRFRPGLLSRYGKTYLFGGQDGNGVLLDDLSEWDALLGPWSQAIVRPPGRMGCGDGLRPIRKSLILFGGSTTWPSSASSGYSLQPSSSMTPGNGTVGTRQWTELSTPIRVLSLGTCTAW